MPLLLVNITATLLCPWPAQVSVTTPHPHPFIRGYETWEGPPADLLARCIMEVQYTHTYTHPYSLSAFISLSNTHKGWRVAQTTESFPLYLSVQALTMHPWPWLSQHLHFKLNTDHKLWLMRCFCVWINLVFVLILDFSWWTFCRWHYFCRSATVAVATHANKTNCCCCWQIIKCIRFCASSQEILKIGCRISLVQF